MAKSTWPSSPVSSSIIKGSLIRGCVDAGSDTNAILMRDDEKKPEIRGVNCLQGR